MSGSSGGWSATECEDDTLPDVLVGHAMFTRHDTSIQSSSSSTFWQHHQATTAAPSTTSSVGPNVSNVYQEQYEASCPPPTHQQQPYSHTPKSFSQNHVSYSQSQGSYPQSQGPYSQSQGPYSQSPDPFLQSPGPYLGVSGRQTTSKPYTPQGLGAHGSNWRNEASGFHDPTRPYAGAYPPSFQESEQSKRYNQQSYATLEQDQSSRFYPSSPSHLAADSDGSYFGRGFTSQPDTSDLRCPSYKRQSETDGRYLAVPVSDASTLFISHSNINIDDSRLPLNPPINIDHHPSTARYRSMSSEPRAGRKDTDGRSGRCSSANRIRKPRSRIFSSASSPLASPPQATSPPPQPISPPAPSGGGLASQPPAASSPPVEVRDWEATTTQDHLGDNRTLGAPPAASSAGSYGYQVQDLEALLSHSSANQPANLPMVLASPTRLHHMRRTQNNSGPSRPFLPLGVIVNAVFKTRDWLYVRTAHGAEGFVPYHVCLPLGILPTKPAHSTTEGDIPAAAAWEMQETLSVPRGRCRERRRAAGHNQTDLQKLHPPPRSSAADPANARDSASAQCYQSQSAPGHST